MYPLIQAESPFAAQIQQITPHLRCFGKITYFPIARASAEVVHRTSVIDVFKNTFCSGISRTRIWSCTPRKRAGIGFCLHLKRERAGPNMNEGVTIRLCLLDAVAFPLLRNLPIPASMIDSIILTAAPAVSTPVFSVFPPISPIMSSGDGDERPALSSPEFAAVLVLGSPPTDAASAVSDTIICCRRETV